MLITGIAYLIGFIVSMILNRYFWPIDEEDPFRRIVLAMSWPLIVFIYCLALPFALYIMIRDFRDGQ